MNQFSSSEEKRGEISTRAIFRVQNFFLRRVEAGFSFDIFISLLINCFFRKELDSSSVVRHSCYTCWGSTVSKSGPLTSVLKDCCCCCFAFKCLNLAFSYSASKKSHRCAKDIWNSISCCFISDLILLMRIFKGAAVVVLHRLSTNHTLGLGGWLSDVIKPLFLGALGLKIRYKYCRSVEIQTLSCRVRSVNAVLPLAVCTIIHVLRAVNFHPYGIWLYYVGKAHNYCLSLATTKNVPNSKLWNLQLEL